MSAFPTPLGSIPAPEDTKYDIEALFAQIVESAPDIIGACDSQGRFIYLNEAGRQWCGLGAGAQKMPEIGSPQLYPAAVAKMIIEVALPAARRDGVWRGETIVRDRAGNERPSDQIIVALRHGDGSVTGFSTGLRDLSAQRATEQALRQSQEQFSKAFYASPDPYVIADFHSNLMVDVNEAYCRVFGVTRNEAIGKRNSDLGLWVDLQERDHFVEILRRDGEVREMEQRRRTRAGKIIICRVTAFRIDIGGRTCSLYRIRDITSERQAEQTLRESEELFAHLFRAAAYPMLAVELATEYILQANDHFCAYVGRSLEELRGHATSEFRFWVDRAERDRIYAEIKEQGAVSGRDVRIFNYAGEARVGRFSAQVTELHGRKCIVSTFEDLTEQRRAERALRTSEEKFSKAFRATPDGISITTLDDGRFLETNDGFARIFGWTRAETLGRTSIELGMWVNPNDRERIAKALRAGEPVVSVSVDGRDKSGTIHHGLFSAERIDVGGQPCLLAVVHDVTDRQRLEEQLRHAQKMESVGQLAGGVAHDFNNILTVIQGHTSFLLDEPSLPPMALDSLRQIQQSAELAANLTRQLLLFSRKQVLRLGRVDLNDVVARMSRLLQRLIGEDIVLEVATMPKLPAIHADVSMVEQVLLNLAVNARDAMPRGGHITLATLTLTTDAEYVRRVPQALPGQFVGLCLRDTGVGIPPEVIPRIFEPFFTTKKEGKGTGLGLATVYGVVQQHSGWIEVESQPGQGTQFTVWFPARPAAAAEPLSAAPAAPAAVRGHETILVVEDKESVRALLAMVLERFGYHVVTASDAMEALAKWVEHKDRIVLLFTDVVMPGHLNGKDLAEQLRGDRPDLKVIFCSGYDANVLDPAALQMPGTRFLAKPFDITRLAEIVRELLDAK